MKAGSGFMDTLTGAKAEKDLIDAKGRLIVAEGTTITDSIKKKLIRFDLISADTASMTCEGAVAAADDADDDKTVNPKKDTALDLSAAACARLYSSCGLFYHHETVQAVNIIKKTLKDIRKNEVLSAYLAGITQYLDWVYSHSINVMLIAVMIALRIGIKDLNPLAVGALFHDVGKIQIPKKIINKPSLLTKAEDDSVKQHPRLGSNLLAPAKLNPLVYLVIEQHHERLDGSGYPNGLRNGDIHLFSQVVAVANVFDAMTSLRLYRQSFSVDDVLKKLESVNGTGFDPLLIATVKSLL